MKAPEKFLTPEDGYEQLTIPSPFGDGRIKIISGKAQTGDRDRMSYHSKSQAEQISALRAKQVSPIKPHW